MNRENAFILLEIDPDQYDSWVSIEPELKKKRALWNRSTLNADFKRYLEWLPDIEKKLKDPEGLRKESEDARTKRRERAEANLVELDRLLKVASAKGYLTDDDIAAVAKVKDSLGHLQWVESAVRDRATKVLHLKLQTAEPKTRTSLPRLDVEMEKRIAKNLNLLGVTDLYSLLSLPASTSVNELLKRTDKELQQIRTRAVKTSEVNVRKNLFEDCLQVFKTKEQRQLYDNSLAAKQYDEIKQRALVAGQIGKHIPLKMMEELIKQGLERGLKREEVSAVIADLAYENKWALEVPSESAFKSLVRCGVCGTLAQEHQERCGDCSTPLQIACPKCTKKNPSSARVCGHCQFAVGDMHLADGTLRDATRANLAGDPARATALVNEALSYWPGHPQALELKKELDRRQCEARDYEQSLRSLVEKIRSCQGKREFTTATKLLTELRQNAPTHPELATVTGAVERAMRDAESQISKGNSLRAQGKLDDAYDAYQLALTVCADSHSARDSLSRCPPSPPSELKAEIIGGSVKLQWRASPSRGQIIYQVVRKSGSQPASPTDGTHLTDIPSAPYTDPKPPTGDRIYYAVFSLRTGATADRAATAGPLVCTTDVVSLQVWAKDSCVSLEWKAPAGVQSVEVWRKVQGEPTARGDGTRVAGTLDSAHDSGLINGTAYGYRVIAVFHDASGQPLASRGATCMATPVRPPAPITDLKLEMTAHDFRADWPAVTSGTDVRVFDRRAPSSVPIGKVLSSADLQQLGNPLPAVGPRAVGDMLNGRTELHLLPVSIVGTVYIAGKGLSHRWVPDVTELKGQYRDDSIILTWKWPSGIDATTLVVRDDTYCTDPKDVRSLRSVRVTLDQFRQAGNQLVLPLPASPRLFVTAIAAINRQGKWEHAPGKLTDCQCEITPKTHCAARYSIRATGNFWMRRTTDYVVTINVNKAVELPELLIVSKHDGLPTKPGEGTVVKKTTPRAARPGAAVEIVIEQAPWPLNRNNTSLFHALDEDGQWLELFRS